MPDEPSPTPVAPAAPAPDSAAAPAKKPRAPKPKAAPAPTPGSAATTPAPKAPAAAPKPKPAGKPSGSPAKPTAPKAAKPAPPPLKGTVVDVSGLVLGRAASVIAQRLLKGEEIVVVNAEKSVVTGSRQNVISFYTANRARGSVRSGPHYPRYPDRIFRRTVRGMLPHLKTRGKEALDRLEVYIGVPSFVGPAKRQSIENARARPSLRPPMTLEQITLLLGARL